MDRIKFSSSEERSGDHNPEVVAQRPRHLLPLRTIVAVFTIAAAALCVAPRPAAAQSASDAGGYLGLNSCAQGQRFGVILRGPWNVQSATDCWVRYWGTPPPPVDTGTWPPTSNELFVLQSFNSNAFTFVVNTGFGSTTGAPTIYLVTLESTMTTPSGTVNLQPVGSTGEPYILWSLPTYSYSLHYRGEARQNGTLILTFTHDQTWSAPFPEYDPVYGAWFTVIRQTETWTDDLGGCIDSRVVDYAYGVGPLLIWTPPSTSCPQQLNVGLWMTDNWKW